ncbi:Retrovirus-related Pol polyprotein from transposon opus [Araneus ventricosus]|uniref:Retrovirus-related Pol polyprotein from transposon opus n=1 Tax=Araneus ventricosus TaxID=182803 RepID=A0A4Y2MAD2_ARAVE|nr:Retrovirus-related Pol polyprotein from transposon opus [Araneus ventricosus]
MNDLDLVFNKLSEHGIVGISPLPEKVQFLKEFSLPKTVQELRRILATLKFSHRFLKDAAKEQACLHCVVKNKVKKDNTHIAWTEDTQSAFKSGKRLIANATALSFPAANSHLSLMTDASDFAVGAVLQQHFESIVEPLVFFSRKLSATEKKYSTFGSELLSIYLSVKHIRYMLEGCEVVILTDHKPLIFVFTRKHNSSPRQIRHLELISQFATDICYIADSRDGPESFPIPPIPDQSADTIARAYLLGWISRFGVPEKVTSDHGTNFQSNLFSSLSKFLGAEQTRTTAYHPQSNEAMKRFHRHLKSALMTHLPENWLDALPLVLFGIRTNFKQDLVASSAGLVYGTTLKLPGEIFSNIPVITSALSFLQILRHHVRSFRPVPSVLHGSKFSLP